VNVGTNHVGGNVGSDVRDVRARVANVDSRVECVRLAAVVDVVPRIVLTAARRNRDRRHDDAPPSRAMEHAKPPPNSQQSPTIIAQPIRA
jgi:hypothetical protein